ncbi:MAG: acetyl-CoA acetyltransferase [bacterium]|nr:acetyl-CoA acetyltransferase [bacterium]
MSLDPRTPVLVGCGQLVQRVDDPLDGAEPLDLMQAAAECAADDSGARDLLRAADSVRILQGLWEYSDPGAILKERFGAEGAQTALGVISGTTVQKLISASAREIASGERDIVVIAGAEAEHSKRRAWRAGVKLQRIEQSDALPDLTVGLTGPMPQRPERDLGLLIPTQWFAMIENALRFRAGRTPDKHSRYLSELWSRFNEVALGNPYAWTKKALSPEEIRTPSADNRMTTYPYTKYMCSNMVVDQAASVILCSVEAAQRHGISEERFVFPHAATECSGVPGLSHRLHMDREPAMEIAGRRALELVELELDAIRYLDLYSCFPSAVQLSAQALEIPADRALSITGGLSFAGGPFNSYVLHATATMMNQLREDPGSFGLITGVGGCLSNHAFGVYSTRPPEQGFRYEELSPAIEALSRCKFEENFDGEATIESYASTYVDGAVSRAIFACRLEDGARTWAVSEDRELLERLTREELVGRNAQLRQKSLLGVL